MLIKANVWKSIGLLLAAGIYCIAYATEPIRSDTAKEQRWAEQIADTLFDGEIVWLEAADHRFLGIDMAPQHESNRALIVVHGIGVHPDWEQVVQPVRVEMADRGWRTLSIQMPVLPNSAEAGDYTPLFPQASGRFDAAISYLRAAGVENIFIVAHSMGAAMSAYFLARSPDPGVRGLVAVGMNAAQRDMAVNAAKSLEKITVPVLDLYGGEDLPAVRETAALRAAAAARNPDYTQTLAPGADHFFNGRDHELVHRIDAWLQLHE